MEQAWQVRDGQRQDLIDSFMTKINRVGDDTENFELFRLELVMALLRLFRPRREGKLSFDSKTAIAVLVEDLNNAIDEFGRTDAEKGLLLSLLTGKVVSAVFHKEHTEYQSEEIHNTMAVLGVKRATDEIEFTD